MIRNPFLQSKTARALLWCTGIASCLLVIVFIRFLALSGEQCLSSPNADALIAATASLNLFWLFQSAEFWQLGLAFYMGGMQMYVGAYSALSLGIFGFGLLTFHHTIHRLSRCTVLLMFVAMGWAHMVLAKVVLSFDLPLKLAGPVSSVGALSLLYFCLFGMLLDVYLCQVKRAR